MNSILKPLSIYIHIPFCISKCHYCSFNSYAGLEKWWHPYFEALNQEIIKFSELANNHEIKTIYFGGGTPTCVDYKYIESALKTVKNNYFITQDTEITIEANPKTVNSDFKYLKSAGINRVSLGLQSSHESELKFLGRSHNYKDFLDAYTLLRNLEIKNINIDLIYGLQNQKLSDWISTLERVIKLTPEHLSLYSLSIEPNTKLYKNFNNKKICPEELNLEMYHYAIDFLINNDYEHYEFSNFARKSSEKDYKSRHNIAYWKCQEYLAFGAGAHSYFNGYRYSNFDSIEKYVNSENKFLEKHKVTYEEAIEEYIFLGFRLLEGVSEFEFENLFNKKLSDLYRDTLSKYLSEGFIQKSITQNGNKYTLSRKGIDISNYILAEFLLN